MRRPHNQYNQLQGHAHPESNDAALNSDRSIEDYLGAIGTGRKEAEQPGGLDGAQNLLPHLGQIHAASLEQQEGDQEENPRALEPTLAQIAIEQERIAQDGAEGEQIRLHPSSKLQDRGPGVPSSAASGRRDLRLGGAEVRRASEEEEDGFSALFFVFPGT